MGGINRNQDSDSHNPDDNISDEDISLETRRHHHSTSSPLSRIGSRNSQQPLLMASGANSSGDAAGASGADGSSRMSSLGPSSLHRTAAANASGADSHSIDEYGELPSSRSSGGSRARSFLSRTKFFRQFASKHAMKHKHHKHHKRDHFSRLHHKQRLSSLKDDTESLSGEPPQPQVPFGVEIVFRKGNNKHFDNVDLFADFIQSYSAKQQRDDERRESKSSSSRPGSKRMSSGEMNFTQVNNAQKNTSQNKKSRKKKKNAKEVVLPDVNSSFEQAAPSTELITPDRPPPKNNKSRKKKKNAKSQPQTPYSGTSLGEAAATTTSNSTLPDPASQQSIHHRIQERKLKSRSLSLGALGTLPSVASAPNLSGMMNDSRVETPSTAEEARTTETAATSKPDQAGTTADIATIGATPSPHPEKEDTTGIPVMRPQPATPPQQSLRKKLTRIPSSTSTDSLDSSFPLDSPGSSQSSSLFDVFTFNKDRPTIWIDITGARESDMEVIGDLFALHPLTVEDCLNPSESGDKYEVMHDVQHKSIYLFLVVKNVGDTLNLLIFKNFVITIHLKEIPELDKVRNRLESEYQREVLMSQNAAALEASRAPEGPHRHNYDSTQSGASKRHKRRRRKFQNKYYTQKLGGGSPCYIPSPSYIAYAYLDQIVDQFLQLSRQKLLHVDDEENVIMQLGTDDMDDALLRINTIRRETRLLRRYLFPKKNMIFDLMNVERIPFLCTSTKIGLRDVYDHLTSSIDNLEEEMSELNTIQSRYLMKMNAEASANNNRMVEMASRQDGSLARLTVITSVFAPLSLISGIFGMNTWVPGTMGADDVPLGSYLAFAGILVFMVLLGMMMCCCFRDQLLPATGFSSLRPRKRRFTVED